MKRCLRRVSLNGFRIPKDQFDRKHKRIEPKGGDICLPPGDPSVHLPHITQNNIMLEVDRLTCVKTDSILAKKITHLKSILFTSITYLPTYCVGHARIDRLTLQKK